MLIRTERTPGKFFTMHKSAVNNEKLSWKAKGIMAYLMSKPPDWQMHVSDLVKRSKDSHHAVRSALKELELEGYLIRRRENDEETGLIYWVCVVYETPVEAGQRSSPEDRKTASKDSVDNEEQPYSGFPHMDNPQVEKPQVENHYPTNNYGSNNDDNKNDIIPPQQNSHISDNTHAIQSPDIDFSSSSTSPTGETSPHTDNISPATVTAQPTSLAGDADFSDWEPTEEEKAPRKPRTAEDVVNATRASTAKYHERKGREPWRDWFPEVMRPHSGISKDRLQWLGWRICQFSGQKPTAREAKAWIGGLASFYLETKGNPSFIDQCIMTGLQRDDPQYRPTHPSGYTKIAVKYNAANRPKVGAGGVVSTEYYGPGGAVEVPGAIYEESLERYFKGVENVE